MDRDLLEKVLNISRHMAGIRALTPLLDYVVDEAVKLVGAERGFIVFIEPDGSLDFRVKRNLEGHEVEDAEDQISKSILNQAIKTGEPLLLYDAMSDPDFHRSASVMDLKLRSIMCVPLTAGGENFGAIYVENRSIRGHFGQDDLSPLIIFANQAAVSIENASLNDDLEKRVATRTSELQQAMNQIENNLAEAMEANRVRREWLNNVTHDLSTPLSIASGWLTLLQQEEGNDLSDQHLEWVASSLDAVNHTLELLGDLFDLSKLDVGGLALHSEMVVLPDFLQGVYEIGLGLSWPEAVTFELDISAQLPDLFIDPLRIRQVLLNLLSNARKFTAEGNVTLQARYLADQEEVWLSVVDTGDGIPPDKVDQLFKPFQQVDDDLERQRKGSGLGLSICRALVEMHGGRIWVDSIPGVGSNFTFTLPLSPPTPDVEDIS